MLFIGQNLKHVHKTYSFLELLILPLINSKCLLFWSLFVYFPPKLRNIICEEDKLQGKTIMK